MPAPAAGAADSLPLSQQSLAAAQLILCLSALGDVLARDQQNGTIVRPRHEFDIFADPKHRAVLAELANFPALRLAGLFQADGNIPFDGLSISFMKMRHHRMTD